VLSAFSGLGGLDLGLESAGFDHAGLVERDSNARRSLKANRDGTWPLLDTPDVLRVARVIKPRDLGLASGELTILAGGPPCQPFSVAAQWASSARIGLADERATPLMGFLALIEGLLPEAVLIENVPGFIQGSTSALDLVERELRRINMVHGTSYATESANVDAARYGVPQRRIRSIVVACRSGQRFLWPAETHTENPMRAWDAIGDSDELREDPMPISAGKWAGLLPSIPEGRNYQWHTSFGGGRELFGYRTRYWSFLLKLAKSKPSWTIAAQPGPATGPFHWDNRPLTTAEMLRLQSFPSTWRVEGVRREKVRQIGNATPPLLAEVFGRAIKRQLGFSIAANGPLLALERRNSVPDPEPILPVASGFLELEGQHAAHAGTGRGPSPRREADESIVAD